MTDFYWYNPSGSANWTSTGASGRWYSASGGTGTKFSSVPTSTDNAIFDANSGAGTCNFPNAAVGNCLNLYCNGYGAVGPTTTQISGGPNSILNVYGSITLSPNQVFDLKQTPKVVMLGSSSATINCNGTSFGDLDIQKTGGQLTLNDDLFGIGNAVLSLTAGTFIVGTKNVTFGGFYTGGSATRFLAMGSGTWTMTFEGESSSIPINTWEVNSSTGLTLDAGTSTIKLLHARNDPSTNDSQVSALSASLSDTDTYIYVTDITPFDVTSGYVWVGEEVIYYSGVNTASRTLIIAGRGIGGTTILPFVPAYTAVLGAMQGNSALQVAITAGVPNNISVTDASKFPKSGVVYIENEFISYTGTDLTLNLLTGISVPANNHSPGVVVYSSQARNFYGGGLTYYNLVIGCLGYRSITYIYGSNTFNSIRNKNPGFTYTPTNDAYPGVLTLSFQAAVTNVVNSFSFTGSSVPSWRQYICNVVSSSAGVQTTLSIIPPSTTWRVGTNSVNGGNNTNISFTGGFTDYLYFQDIIGLPVTATSVGNFFIMF